MESKMFAFGVVMLFCIVQSIEGSGPAPGLKCYSCNSDTNPKCADIKDKGLEPVDCVSETVLSQGAAFISQLVNSNSKPLGPVCLKYVTRNNTRVVVHRKCAVKFENQDPCFTVRNVAPQPGVSFQTEFCGVCEKDGCNSGNSMQLFSTLIVFGAMVCTARLFV